MDDTADSLKQNYGRIVKVYQTVIPVSVKTAETSAAGKSIYAYDKNGAAAKAYQTWHTINQDIVILPFQPR